MRKTHFLAVEFWRWNDEFGSRRNIIIDSGSGSGSACFNMAGFLNRGEATTVGVEISTNLFVESALAHEKLIKAGVHNCEHDLMFFKANLENFNFESATQIFVFVGDSDHFKATVWLAARAQSSKSMIAVVTKPAYYEDCGVDPKDEALTHLGSSQMLGSNCQYQTFHLELNPRIKGQIVNSLKMWAKSHMQGTSSLNDLMKKYHRNSYSYAQYLAKITEDYKPSADLNEHPARHYLGQPEILTYPVGHISQTTQTKRARKSLEYNPTEAEEIIQAQAAQIAKLSEGDKRSAEENEKLRTENEFLRKRFTEVEVFGNAALRRLVEHQAGIQARTGNLTA